MFGFGRRCFAIYFGCFPSAVCLQPAVKLRPVSIHSTGLIHVIISLGAVIVLRYTRTERPNADTSPRPCNSKLLAGKSAKVTRRNVKRTSPLALKDLCPFFALVDCDGVLIEKTVHVLCTSSGECRDMNAQITSTARYTCGGVYTGYLCMPAVLECSSACAPYTDCTAQVLFFRLRDKAACSV